MLHQYLSCKLQTSTTLPSQYSLSSLPNWFYWPCQRLQTGQALSGVVGALLQRLCNMTLIYYIKTRS